MEVHTDHPVLPSHVVPRVDAHLEFLVPDVAQDVGALGHHREEPVGHEAERQHGGPQVEADRRHHDHERRDHDGGPHHDQHHRENHEEPAEDEPYHLEGSCSMYTNFQACSVTGFGDMPLT